MQDSVVFGPVPSRRLGRSLGINNIPDKVCTYACVYCQIGRTLKMEMERREFYPPELIFKEAEKKVSKAEDMGEKIDYITFVPDGEPTLDVNLGKEIELLSDIGIKLAIITNSSLLYREDVREELMNLDFVSLKLDAVTPELWKRIDRPHKSLKLHEILDGMLQFRREFGKKIVTETMLIGDISYSSELGKMGEFLKKLKPNVAYIAVPTRPPLESWVKPPEEDVLLHAYHEFVRVLGEERVEYLIGYEGDAFAFTGNFEEDLLSITAVHPMKKEAVETLLRKANANWDIVERLITEGKLMERDYQGQKFYMRRLKSRDKP